MNKLLFVIFCGLCCQITFAQNVPGYIRRNFSNCYTGHPTGLGGKLAINGYYRCVKLGKFNQGYGKSLIESDSTTMNILFYEDGTFLYNFWVIDRQSRPEGNPFIEQPEKVVDYLKKAAENPKKYGFYGQQFWGIYSVTGDTIIMQYINRKGSLNDDWSGWQIKFRIMDKTHIEYLANGKRPLSHQSNASASDPDAALRFLTAIFVPCREIPAPDCWLKKEDWTWCK